MSRGSLKNNMNQGFDFNLNFPYDELSDPRTENWLLVKSFSHVALLVTIYLLVVWRLPKRMSRREPFNLRIVLIFYNLTMALLNARICQNALVGAMRSNYNFLCQPCRVVFSNSEMQIATAVWWFYISKCLEFADTVFLILRKKTNQLTFLHVFHHSTMFPIQWLAIKWVPTGSSIWNAPALEASVNYPDVFSFRFLLAFLPATINSFVHVIMYSYYGLSALGPRFQKYLWWKKYLTALQLFQFSICWLWAFNALASDCEFPRWISYSTITYMTTFLVLFGRFYSEKYVAKDCKNVDLSKKLH